MDNASFDFSRALQQVDETLAGEVKALVGNSNPTYGAIATSGRCFAVRLLRDQSPDAVEEEGVLQRALHDFGIRSPLNLALKNGRQVDYIGEQPFTISDGARRRARPKC